MALSGRRQSAMAMELMSRTRLRSQRVLFHVRGYSENARELGKQHRTENVQ